MDNVDDGVLLSSSQMEVAKAITTTATEIINERDGGIDMIKKKIKVHDGNNGNNNRKRSSPMMVDSFLVKYILGEDNIRRQIDFIVCFQSFLSGNNDHVCFEDSNDDESSSYSSSEMEDDDDDAIMHPTHGNGHGSSIIESKKALKRVKLTSSKAVSSPSSSTTTITSSSKSTLSLLLEKFLIQVSLIGSGKVILVVLCFLLWRCDPRLGWKPTNAAAHMLLACGLAKAYLKGPRPYFLDDRVQTLDPTLEESYGFPSGHTSGTVSIYGLIAAFYFHDFIPGWIMFFMLCTLIGISRIYTGAHFITDVLGGALLGLLLLWNELRYFDKHTEGTLEDAGYLLSIALVCATAICYASYDSARGKIHFKLNQEGISGIGFSFGLGLCHLLEKYYQPSLCRSSDANEVYVYRPLPWHACVIAVVGIVIIDLIRKKTVDTDGEVSPKGLVIICSCYSMIMIWANWMIPNIFAPECVQV